MMSVSNVACGQVSRNSFPVDEATVVQMLAERVSNVTCPFPVVERGGDRLVVKSRLSPGEVQISMKIPIHPHLVRVYGTDEQQKYLFLEYVPGVSPTKASFLQLPKEERMSAIQSVLRQIASALQVLEKEHIVYADLKPANIQIDQFLDPLQRRAVIFDFGTSFSVDEGPRGSLGTNGYIAPEVQDRGKIDNKFDVYAFGQLISTILTDGGMYIEHDDSSFYENAIELGATEDQAKDALDLMRRCTLPCPEPRPTFEDVLAHPFMAGEGHTEYQPQFADQYFMDVWLKINEEAMENYLLRSKTELQLEGLSTDKVHALSKEIMENALSQVSQAAEERMQEKHMWRPFVEWITGPAGMAQEYRNWLVHC